LLAILVCVSLFAYAGPQDGSVLQGKWRAIEATSNGEPPPPGMLESLPWSLTAEECLSWFPTDSIMVDDSFTPAHIDILNSRHQVGIYELKGDALKVVFGMDGDRPKGFTTEKHTDRTYMLLNGSKSENLTPGW